MFPSLGSFRDIPCPDADSCNRAPCIFSHKPGQSSSAAYPKLQIPVADPPAPVTSTSSAVPAKRPALSSPQRPRSSSPSSSSEPPRKLQKLGLQSRAFPSAEQASSTEVRILPICNCDSPLSARLILQGRCTHSQSQPGFVPGAYPSSTGM